ncbi:MAG: glycosyltransferase [Patescibacteria group bacterium]
MNVALIHDHLMQEGGAERVLKAISEVYPDAPIFTLLYDAKKLNRTFAHDRVRPSFLQHIPFAKHSYQWLLPLMPLATEMYNLSDYDVIISSSSAFSKGVLTKPGSVHICYCHTPTRYLWTDTLSYVQDMKHPRFVKALVPPMLSRMRIWDRLAADRVDYFIANSLNVSERIKKYYNRSSAIIYPPIDVSSYNIGRGDGGYYLAGGRLVSYKRYDIIIDAFNRLGIPLHIFGSGPSLDQLRSNAKKNITFLGALSDSQLQQQYMECTAFIHPQEEDFGITPVEAMAAGRPVIAYAAGGALETVLPGVTGHFFTDQDYAALIDVILHFKPEYYRSDEIHKHAMQFDTSVFKQSLRTYVDSKYRKL